MNTSRIWVTSRLLCGKCSGPRTSSSSATSTSTADARWNQRATNTRPFITGPATALLPAGYAGFYCPSRYWAAAAASGWRFRSDANALAAESVPSIAECPFKVVEAVQVDACQGRPSGGELGDEGLGRIAPCVQEPAGERPLAVQELQGRANPYFC